MAYHMSEQPTMPGVYRVLVKLHGTWHPRPHEPDLFAYWDGVDSWSTWEFSAAAALRAPCVHKIFRPWSDRPRLVDPGIE